MVGGETFLDQGIRRATLVPTCIKYTFIEFKLTPFLKDQLQKPERGNLEGDLRIQPWLFWGEVSSFSPC